MNANEIKELILEKFSNSTVQIEGDDGHHFNAIIVSELFENKSLIQRQRMVYAALGNAILDGSIHALSMKTYTPLEWQQTYNSKQQ